MKATVVYVFFILMTGSHAQTPVIPLHQSAPNLVENAYYKDTDNFLDQYVGTWLYSSGSTSLEIKLVKKEMFYYADMPVNYYTDFIVGEYRYVENNVVKVNTLDNLNQNHNVIFDYNINGNIKISAQLNPSCDECAANESRLYTGFTEPSRRNVQWLSGQMVFRRFEENGVQKLKVWAYISTPSYGNTITGEPTTIDDFSLPEGEYVLIKQ